ncbi:MAG: DUF177 domain-containing protein, partial [Candidatus Omnitrophota bacterium]
SADGLAFEDKIDPASLDLDTGLVEFLEPIRAKAEVYKITNALSVNLKLSSRIGFTCGRCLEDFKEDYRKDIQLNYSLDSSQQYLDLDQDIRAEIILEYPFNPLCKADCKGLCPGCGKNLNQEKCSCNLKGV